jgi:hypothetical protein
MLLPARVETLGIGSGADGYFSKRSCQANVNW